MANEPLLSEILSEGSNMGDTSNMNQLVQVNQSLLQSEYLA